MAVFMPSGCLVKLLPEEHLISLFIHSSCLLTDENDDIFCITTNESSKWAFGEIHYITIRSFIHSCCLLIDENDNVFNGQEILPNGLLAKYHHITISSSLNRENPHLRQKPMNTCPKTRQCSKVKPTQFKDQTSDYNLVA
ncbi:hypothetical protein Hanom_Chr09g00842771 [Helianthus anomalus]